MIGVDIAILVILIAFLLYGLWFGFVHTLTSFLGAIAGFWAGGHLTAWLIARVGTLWFSPEVFELVVFLFFFGLVSRLLGLVVWVIDRVFGVAKLIPLVPTTDRLLGALLGLLEGIVLLGIALSFASKQFTFPAWTVDSVLIPIFHRVFEPLLALFI